VPDASDHRHVVHSPSVLALIDTREHQAALRVLACAVFGPTFGDYDRFMGQAGHDCALVLENARHGLDVAAWAATLAKLSPEEYCLGRVLPGAPTDAPPGSAAKIQVLADRAGKGLALHHPGDAAADGARVCWLPSAGGRHVFAQTNLRLGDGGRVYRELPTGALLAEGDDAPRERPACPRPTSRRSPRVARVRVG
jgi:hypothetical protein